MASFLCHVVDLCLQLPEGRRPTTLLERDFNTGTALLMFSENFAEQMFSITPVNILFTVNVALKLFKFKSFQLNTISTIKEEIKSIKKAKRKMLTVQQNLYDAK